MDAETRKYLDGPWELRTDTTGQHGAIYVKGKPILRLDVNEPRMLAKDVGEYILELKRDRERLEWRLTHSERRAPLVSHGWPFNQWREWIDEQMALNAEKG